MSEELHEKIQSISEKIQNEGPSEIINNLINLQNNKSCTEISYKNPAAVYVTVSIVILLLSSLGVAFNFNIVGLLLLPFKLLLGLLWIMIFAVLLILSCNFLSDTITWILAIIFILFSLLGSTITILLGVVFLILMYVLGISAATVVATIYYYRDTISNYFSQPSKAQEAVIFVENEKVENEKVENEKVENEKVENEEVELY